MSRLNDQQKFNEWLGKYLTQPLRFRSRKNSAFFLNVQLDKVDASSDDDSEYADDSYDFSNDSFDDEDDDLDIDEVLKAMVDIEIVSVKSNDNDDNSNDISYEDEKDLASKDSESIDQISEIGDPLPFAISTSFSVASQKKFDSAEDVMLSVINGQCNLRRAEGVKMAYIDEIMFIDGEVAIGANNSVH